jgi:tetratricopeptide (TPR) repeat protein
MANLKSKDQRHVIPNWRRFDITANLGELNGKIDSKQEASFKPEIDDLLDDWETNKTIGVAADILGVAISLNQTETKEISEIARFVIENQDISSSSLKRAAHSVLKVEKKSKLIFETDDLDATFNLQKLYISISRVKKILRINPRNAIAWVELGRLYSIQGLDEKAERSILNAIFLAPENRYVLRSMARFYSHVGNTEFADKFLKKAQVTKFDPWVMASSIALSDLRGTNSKFAKSALLKINSDSLNPFASSELSSALASLELKNGKLKNSKKLFRKSLIDPNDNALAQAEWASQKEIKLDVVNPSKFKLDISYEALARDSYEKGDWETSLDYSSKWFFDMPYSKQAIVFGYDIALHKLGDYKRASNIGKMGLISHPNDPFLLNNIMYTLSLNNEHQEADLLYSKIKSTKLKRSNPTNICLIATKGLISYRQGNQEKGKKLYLEAIEIAKDFKNDELANLALINFAREEIRYSGEYDIEVINKLKKIKEKSKDDQLIELINDVLDLANDDT